MVAHPDCGGSSQAELCSGRGGPGEKGGCLGRWVDRQSRLRRYNSADSMAWVGAGVGSDQVVQWPESDNRARI